MSTCEHYFCRCIRAEELSQMADAIEARHGVPTSESMQLRYWAQGLYRVQCRMTEAEAKAQTPYRPPQR